MKYPTLVFPYHSIASKMYFSLVMVTLQAQMFFWIYMEAPGLVFSSKAIVKFPDGIKQFSHLLH